MSRRSSYGYSRNSSRTYRSGKYTGRRKRNKKIRILIIVLAVLLICAAVFALLWFLVLNRDNESSDSNNTDKEMSSQSSVSEIKPDTSSGPEKETSSESSDEESEPDPDLEGYRDGNVFVYDKKGYEMFYGTDGSAEAYAAVVSKIKSLAGDGVNVYNMVVPNHAPFGLPEKYLSEMNDEQQNIKKIYSSYTENVIPIDVYETEKSHRKEYTYFKTDNNWTSLGAYYAYQEFCKSLGMQAVELEKLQKGSIPDFRGALCAATKTDENPDGNKELAGNPDMVVYYNMPGIESCILLENGRSEEREVSLIAAFAEGSNAYSAFIWGNNPYMKVTTTQKTGRKLCIIKDSYGCAFAPFTTANFDEVYIVDPSYYVGNVMDYIKENKFTDVLVINSIMNANTSFRLDEINSILG